LRREFPGHTVSIGNNAVTLSNLPLAAPPKPIGLCSLRVDVVPPGSGGAMLSTYNVHIPAQLRLMSPLTRQFYRNIRSRAADRRLEYHALIADLQANPLPCVIAGDFNTSPAIGELRRIRAVARDESRVLAALYPVTWNARSRVPLWRLDWLFTRGDAMVARYELNSPRGLSDHRIQSAVVRTVTRK
jgi:Endonuclease/Exonuclease/phosphatase family